MKTTLEDIAFLDDSDMQSNMTVPYRFDLDNIASKKGWCVWLLGRNQIQKIADSM